MSVPLQTSAPSQLGPLTALLLEAVRDLCRAEGAALLERQADGSLVLEMADGGASDHVLRRRLGPGEGIAGRVLATGRAEVARPPFAGIADELRERCGYETRSVLAVPLFDASGAPVGVAEAVNPIGRPAFDEDDLARLAAVGPSIATALTAIDAMATDPTAMARFYQAVLEVVAARAAVLRAHTDHLESTRLSFEMSQAQHYSDEKMAGLARMAAGIAHEINNPLAVVLSSVRSLASATQDLCATVRALGRALDAPASSPEAALLSARDALVALDPDGLVPDMGQMLQEIQSGLERISGIVSRLTIFGDQDPGRLDVIDLAAEGRRISSLLLVHGLGRQGGLPLDVQVESVPPIRACRAKVQQLLVELVDNALKAAAKTQAEEGGRVQLRVYAEGGDVHVRVTDNGPGIRPDAQKRIFDPFYTTKSEWRAVGLGLSVAYGVVRSLGGRIALESAPQQGARVTVSLPVEAAHQPQTSERARTGRYYEDLR